MTANTKQALKDILVKKISSEEGYVVVIDSATEKQMIAIKDKIVELTGFNEADLTDEDVMSAGMFIDMFSNKLISGNVQKSAHPDRHDGVLVPASDEEFATALTEVEKAHAAGMFTRGTVLTVAMLSDALVELGEFRRF